MSASDIFWKSSIDDIKRGYIEEENKFICLLCSKEIEKGIVYNEFGVLYQPERYMRIHIKKEHNSVFDYLITLNKKYTGLTEHQSNLIKLFYQGKSDQEIQKALDIGSSSTIRNHRYVLKEKERQAKVFLVLMELLNHKDVNAPAFVEFHNSATMVDDRYNVTIEESKKIIKKYFPDGVNGRLKTFSMKEKNKLVVLREIIKRFQVDETYTEKEINSVLKEIYDDFATIRRYLIEYGFMDRTKDGSKYWIKK